MTKATKRYETLMPTLLADLRASANAARMQVRGELHLQHHEACVWVLLADKVDARAALLALRPTLARHQAQWPEITVTLSFNAIEGNVLIFISLLQGRDIHDARQLADLDKDPQSTPLSEHDRSFWEIDVTIDN